MNKLFTVKVRYMSAKNFKRVTEGYLVAAENMTLAEAIAVRRVETDRPTVGTPEVVSLKEENEAEYLDQIPADDDSEDIQEAIYAAKLYDSKAFIRAVGMEQAFRAMRGMRKFEDDTAVSLSKTNLLGFLTMSGEELDAFKKNLGSGLLYEGSAGAYKR
mgnify:CR=1 FL=1